MIKNLTCLLTVILTMLLSSCAQSSNAKVAPHLSGRHEPEFQVTVSSNGREIRDFETKLVHRVRVSVTELKRISATLPNRLSIPFDGRGELDHNGRVAGLRMRRISTREGLPTLGIEDGDLLMAVGKRKVQTPQDLNRLPELIRRDGTTSITVIRDGRPHKIFYNLAG